MDTFFFFLPIENKLFLQFYITPIYTTIGIGKCTFDVVIVYFNFVLFLKEAGL